MWESPITMITEDIMRDITSKTEETLVEYVCNVGFDVNKDELTKALAYDRGQYEKGYADGRADRDAEIVRCKECKNHEWCSIEDMALNDETFFCKWGERRWDE